MNQFLEFLQCREEFVFWYCGVRYEIIYENGGQLLLFQGNPPENLVAKYKDTKDFLERGSICGKTITGIAPDVQFS